MIDYDQYNDPNYNDYHKEAAYSYYQDGTVSDELDGELDWRDIENTVGVDFMAYFRDNPDEDLCYVRNNENRVDYTIQRVEGYYETTIDLADNLPDDNELEGEE